MENIRVKARFIGKAFENMYAKNGIEKNKIYLILPRLIYSEKYKKILRSLTVIKKQNDLLTVYYEDCQDLYKDWRILGKVDYNNPMCRFRKTKNKRKYY